MSDFRWSPLLPVLTCTPQTLSRTSFTFRGLKLSLIGIRSRDAYYRTWELAIREGGTWLAFDQVSDLREDTPMSAEALAEWVSSGVSWYLSDR